MNSKKVTRANFRDDVFARDGYKCRVCGSRAEDMLDAHHITNRNFVINGGYVPENGITLCPFCHLQAEQYHNTEKPCECSPEELYELIGSSYEKAVKASEKLKE
ncbi:hypothetical protein LCGC14_1292350 [marine sediment metagenome]|uniref:HNH nuclease domain-containing protein n=1 Tax=marine sediment metagenome TaxID=412755 RepID=A0A0F9LCV2_9ZZZZ